MRGGRIDRISQPFHDMVVFNLYNRGESYRLLISASPECARIHLTQKFFENPLKAPMFLMLLRKHLLGGRILDIRQVNGDRILQIDIIARNELGDEGIKTLYFEAMGRYTNLTLVENGMILDAARRVSDHMSRVRTILPGLPFVMPPRQDKIAPEEATKDALFQKLSGQTGKLENVLAASITGLSMQSARELSYRVAGKEGILLSDLPLNELCENLSKLLLNLPSLHAPQLNISESGDRLEALPFCYYTKRGFTEKPTDTLSQAVETAFDEGDRQTRHRQRTQSLARVIENAQKGRKTAFLRRKSWRTPPEWRNFVLTVSCLPPLVTWLKKGRTGRNCLTTTTKTACVKLPWTLPCRPPKMPSDTLKNTANPMSPVKWRLSKWNLPEKS